MLALDLGVLNKKDHEIGVKEALRWTVLWVAASLLFDVFVYFAYEHHWLGIGLHEGAVSVSGMEAATQYLTGYIIEKSLSLDNIFVMAAIFGYFRIPRMYQHRVLFWGILRFSSFAVCSFSEYSLLEKLNGDVCFWSLLDFYRHQNAIEQRRRYLDLQERTSPGFQKIISGNS
jgi:hypothetical protein